MLITTVFNESYIITAVQKSHNPYGDEPTSFSGGGGKIPEGIAMTLLKCGAGLATAEYIALFLL